MAQAPKNFNPNFTVTTESHGKPAREGITSNIILTIFIVLFIIAFSRVLFGGVPLTFSGFLQKLTTVPDIVLDTSVIDFSLTGSWGWFDFFRDFINSLIGIVNVTVYWSSLIGNLFLILIWSVGFVLGF